MWLHCMCDARPTGRAASPLPQRRAASDLHFGKGEEDGGPQSLGLSVSREVSVRLPFLDFVRKKKTCRYREGATRYKSAASRRVQCLRLGDSISTYSLDSFDQLDEQIIYKP